MVSLDAQSPSVSLCLHSVKSCFQNMEICKRHVNMYDTVNQSKTPFITHVAPSTSTNLTMTFNNQLNTVHSQVNLQTNSLAPCAAGQPPIGSFACYRMQACKLF